ncbi:MAG: hypothetical protein FWJ83_01770 [Limnochordales bacterium]
MSGAVRALLFKELREGRWKYLIAAVVLVALGVSIPVTHQFIAGMLEQFMDDPAVPQALRDLLPPDLLEMSTYLWTNWHAKNLYQTVAVIALVFGSGAVAGEFSRGTAPYLFSRAVVRRSVLAVKTAVDLAGMALAMLLGTAALDVTARIAHGYAVSGAFYAGLVPALAGSVFVYGLALLISTRIDDPVKAGVAAAVAAALFSIPTFVPAWRQWSVYVQMTGRSLFETGTFPWLPVLVIAALAAALLAAAAYSLERRDI